MLFNYLPKPLLFGLFAAIGCFIGALLGEILLSLQPTASNAMVLLIDTSGSMGKSGKLPAVQEAAKHLVDQRTDEKGRIRGKMAVVSFNTKVDVASTLTNHPDDLKRAISGLKTQGYTAMDAAIEKAIELLEGVRADLRFILLFTDGYPEPKFLIPTTQEKAALAKSKHIHLITVSTPDADIELLKQIASQKEWVYSAEVGHLDEAFSKAERTMNSLVERSHVANQPSVFSLSKLLWVGGWTALLALTIGLALIIGQNAYCHRRLLSLGESMIALRNGLLFGFMAGAVGQLLYITAPTPTIETMTHFIGWSVLGLLVGFGTATFITNLSTLRASIAGAIGGAVGALGFLLINQFATGDTVISRLLGAVILGFAIGLMVSWVDELSRKAWLIIQWGPKDKSEMTLGKEPIIVGSSREAHICLPSQFPAEVGRIFFTGSQVAFHNKLRNEQQLLKDGSTWTIGPVSILVKIME